MCKEIELSDMSHSELVSWPVSTTSTFWPNRPLRLEEGVVLPDAMADDSS